LKQDLHSIQQLLLFPIKQQIDEFHLGINRGLAFPGRRRHAKRYKKAYDKNSRKPVHNGVEIVKMQRQRILTKHGIVNSALRAAADRCGVTRNKRSTNSGVSHREFYPGHYP